MSLIGLRANMNEQLEFLFKKPFNLNPASDFHPDYSCSPADEDGCVTTIYVMPYHGRRFWCSSDCQVYLGLGFVWSNDSYVIREINTLQDGKLELWAEKVG